MNIPGFNAEASLYRSTGRYRSTITAAEGAEALAYTSLYCPNKGCGQCVRDPTSSLGGRKCCCHPPADPETGTCDPRIVECVWPPSPPPPPPPDNPECHNFFCRLLGLECCGSGCCPKNKFCCGGVRCCHKGTFCLFGNCVPGFAPE